ERARKDASVQLWDEPSGNTALAGRELNRAAAIAADARLTAYARWLQAHGAEGTLDQLRAAVFTARLSDQPLDTLLPDHPAGGGPGSAGSDGQGSPPASPGAPGHDDNNGPGPADHPRDNRAPGDAQPAGSSNTADAPPGGAQPGPGWPGGTGPWWPAV